MRKLSKKILYLLLSLFCLTASAQQYFAQNNMPYQPYGYQPYGYQPVPGMQPQQPGNEDRAGVPRSQQPVSPYAGEQAWPQQYGYPYQQRPVQATRQQRFTPPKVKATISDKTPYEQQSLIYTIRVVSSGNVKTMAPELPDLDSVVMRKLGDAVTTTNERDDGKEYITEYRYFLMPLATGIVRIPPARISGVRTGRDALPYEVAASDELVIQVRPAAAAVQPWLPLSNLHIDTKLLDAHHVEAGKPITMEVEITVEGTTGAQIPSIARQLEGAEDFRVYPVSNETRGQIVGDGRMLRGSRVERFTLVPLYSGWLKIPTLRLDWWNVLYNRPEVAAYPQRHIRATGSAPAKSSITADGAVPQHGWRAVLFWLPLFAALGIALYGLMGAAFVGSGKLPGIALLGNLFKPVLGDMYTPVATFVGKYSPRRHFHRLRAAIGHRLPVSWKLWFCLRAVAREHDAEAWGQALQFLAAKHLGVRPQSDLKELGQQIAACHPRANASQVDRLMRELDAAIYGGKPIKSFTRWKHEFDSQIAPSLFPIRFRQCKRLASKRTELPRLNPTI